MKIKENKTKSIVFNSDICNSWYIGESMEISMTKELLKQDHIMHKRQTKAIEQSFWDKMYKRER